MPAWTPPPPSSGSAVSSHPTYNSGWVVSVVVVVVGGGDGDGSGMQYRYGHLLRLRQGRQYTRILRTAVGGWSVLLLLLLVVVMVVVVACSTGMDTSSAFAKVATFSHPMCSSWWVVSVVAVVGGGDDGR